MVPTLKTRRCCPLGRVTHSLVGWGVWDKLEVLALLTLSHSERHEKHPGEDRPAWSWLSPRMCHSTLPLLWGFPSYLWPAWQWEPLGLILLRWP